MRISDWSSDVCSSDLLFDILRRRQQIAFGTLGQQLRGVSVDLDAGGLQSRVEPRRKLLALDRPDIDAGAGGIERLEPTGFALALVERTADHNQQRVALQLRGQDRKSTRLNSSHQCASRLPS